MKDRREKQYVRTLRLNENTKSKLDDMAEYYGSSMNSIIERCINEFADGRPDSKLSVEKRLNKIEEQLYHLMNMCNSICTSLNIKSDEYASAENRPSEVLNNSENDLNIYMMRLKGKI